MNWLDGKHQGLELVPHLETVQSIAQAAHRGQTYGKMPYYDGHIRPVVAKVLTLAGVSPAVVLAAYLHDVLEDSHYTQDQLLGAGVPDLVVDVVVVLTRQEGEAYFDYVRRVAKDPLARLVKIADAWVNYHQCLLDGNLKRASRYQQALLLLEAV